MGYTSEALELGRVAERKAHEAMARGALPNETKRQRECKPEERLRAADPW